MAQDSEEDSGSNRQDLRLPRAHTGHSPMRHRLPVFRGDFALACLNIPVHRQEFPVRFSQGISAEPLGMRAHLTPADCR